ncbi:hypothetical protein CR513_45160, partial [Mucuna pruriens]
MSSTLSLTCSASLFPRSFDRPYEGGPSKGVAGFSQENRSPTRVASGADSSSSDGLQSSSSSGEVFPFKIWYKDNIEDNISKDPFSWVETDVKRAFSQYIQDSLLLGMTKKLLQVGPWTVRLRPCRPNESVNNQVSPDEAPFFYIYEPIFSKLGLKLPFTTFERSILQALNVAPSQLHPNSWVFVRAFERLCEDLGREPSLGVLPGQIRPESHARPAVSVTIVRKDLEKWEDEFIRELETLPRLFCSELIRGSGSEKQIPPTAEEGTSALVDEVPQAAAPLREILAQPSPPFAGSQAVWSAKEQPTNEDNEERPSKCIHLEGDAEPQDDLPLAKPGRPSHPMWVKSGLISEAVDRAMLTPFDGLLVKQLGISGTLDTIQRLAGCSAILARATEVEFERQVWERTRAEYDDQLASLKRTVAGLQEELLRSADQHALSRAEWDARQGALVAKVESVNRSIQAGQEKISSLESDVAALRAKVASQDDQIKAKDATILQRGTTMVRQYEYGFNHVLAQAKILHPDLDLSGADPYKEIVDGQIVDVPSP